MTWSIHTPRPVRRLTLALAIVACLPGGIVLAAECAEGVDFRTVDYFKPARSDYPKYVFQGNFPFSLCNPAHGTPLAEELRSMTCDNIDLKGYLYLPKHGGESPFAGPPTGTADAIATTAHDLPLIVYVGGAVENEEHPNWPAVYPDDCNQGLYFSDQGFAYLVIVRRGYKPSTGENELLHTGDRLDYLANYSFEVHRALTYMRGLKNSNGKPLIDPERAAVMGHSLGGIITLFYADARNIEPLRDACQCPEPQLIAKAKALIAPSSQSWDGYDRRDGVLDDDSGPIARLKTAAANALLPSYYLEPLNDASPRPAVVLGKAAGDHFLAINQSCRENVYETALAIDTPKTLARRIVDICPLAGIEYQSALFPVVDLTNFPDVDSAHGKFTFLPGQIAKWGPSVVEFFARYGVK